MIDYNKKHYYTANMVKTSTPLIQDRPIRGRRGITRHYPLESPIDRKDLYNVNYKHPDPHSDYDDEDDLEHSIETDNISKGNSSASRSYSKEEQKNTTGSIINYIALIVILIFSFFVGLYFYENPRYDNISDSKLQEKFKHQEEDFILHLTTGINDVSTIKHHTNFILLYEQSAEETMENLLDLVSKYAVCKIRDCHRDPVIINGESLINDETLEGDYGKIIEKYRYLLKENGLMIVKNLDQIPSKYAPAFHSICDEFYPLVDKSVVIFTMKVNEYRPRNYDLLETKLRLLWIDLDDEIFHPLFTRISSVILNVYPET